MSKDRKASSQDQAARRDHEETLKHLAELNLQQALNRLRQACIHPDYPGILTPTLDIIRVNIITHHALQNRIRALERATIHPKIIRAHSEPTREYLAQKNAYTIVKPGEPPLVLLNLDYAQPNNSAPFLHELLAEEVAHATTTNIATIPISSLPHDSIYHYTLTSDLDAIQRTKGLRKARPTHLDIRGYRANITDANFEYFTVAISLALEEIRARILSIHLLGHSYNLPFNQGVARQRQATSLFASIKHAPSLQEMMVIDLCNSIGWDPMVHVAHQGTADQFIATTSAAIGQDSTMQFVDTFYELEMAALT